MIQSPDFPPLHTVHEAFTSYGVPSDSYYCICTLYSNTSDLWPFLNIHYKCLHKFDHYFSVTINELIILRLKLSFVTFPCSVNSIFTYVLRFLLWACNHNISRPLLQVRYIGYFIQRIFTLPQLHFTHFCADHFRLVHSQFRQS